MKHYTYCFDCTDRVISIGEVEPDLIALCECPYGHKMVMKLGSHLCDTLYSSAVNAYIKECLSESVMSFAAALERAYEMFTKVTLNKEGVDYKEIELFWKELSRQSERQYGAFCTQFLKTHKHSWKANAKMIEFRNKVVHKGYIPSTAEVTEYAEYVTENLYKLLKHLNKHYEHESLMYYFHEAGKSQKKVLELVNKHNAKVVVTSGLSLLNWNVMDMPEVNFFEAVMKLKSVGIIGKM
jgi:hypothetical protein